jgi:hypothetical protein
MQENHKSRNLKYELYCIFRDVSPDISMAVIRVNYFQKAVTQRKVSCGRYHCHWKEPKTWSMTYQNNNPQMQTNSKNLVATTTNQHGVLCTLQQ